MKQLLFILGAVVLGYLGYQYFRKQTPLEQHFTDEKDLQNLGATVAQITNAAVPTNAQIGVKPLTTVELNPILARSLADQTAPLGLYMRLGDTNI